MIRSSYSCKKNFDLEFYSKLLYQSGVKKAVYISKKVNLKWKVYCNFCARLQKNHYRSLKLYSISKADYLEGVSVKPKIRGLVFDNALFQVFLWGISQKKKTKRRREWYFYLTLYHDSGLPRNQTFIISMKKYSYNKYVLKLWIWN